MSDRLAEIEATRKKILSEYEFSRADDDMLMLLTSGIPWLLARVRELKAQAERYKTSLLDLAIEIGPCRCGPEYTGRGLIAPNCTWHQSLTPEILEEAGLLGEYQARLDAALAAREAGE